MNEEFLHYIWKYRLYDPSCLVTPEGEPVEILHPGDQNPHAGPDFTNAKIRSGPMLWAGNVEIHFKSSDWFIHQHHRDPAYNNVILHVVGEHDKEVANSRGEIVPHLVLRFRPSLAEAYYHLLKTSDWAACKGKIARVDSFVLFHWMSRLGIERLEKKSSLIIREVEDTKGDWQEVFYRTVLKTLGTKINAQPFEMLARAVPYPMVARHRKDPFILEALFMGQAGLLPEELYPDEYLLSLKKEYSFHQKKYGLKPLEGHIWKFMRIRPANFPTIRLSQVSSLLAEDLLEFSYWMENPGREVIDKITRCQASEYWHSHYRFNHPIKHSTSRHIGKDIAILILINAVVPVLFAWGMRNGNQDMKDKAVELLEKIDPEKNSIINRWEQLGVKARHSADTQALLELRNSYCEKRYCLRCAIGSRIIASSNE